MTALRITLLVSAAAVLYGVGHDQLTVQVCEEYFSLAHPALFPVRSPGVLALCWGVAATLPVGLVLGVLLGRVCTSEGRPQVPARRLLAPVAGLLALMAVGATAAGGLGYWLTVRGWLGLPAAFAEMLPPERHARFMAAWLAHGASYFAGLTGGGALVLHHWRARGRPAVLALWPRSGGAWLRAAVILALAALVLWWRLGG